MRGSQRRLTRIQWREKHRLLGCRLTLPWRALLNSLLYVSFEVNSMRVSRPMLCNERRAGLVVKKYTLNTALHSYGKI